MIDLNLTACYSVSHAHLLGNTIGLIARNEFILIPGDSVPSQAMADQLMQLLQQKAGLREN